MNIVIVSGEAT